MYQICLENIQTLFCYKLFPLNDNYITIFAKSTDTCNVKTSYRDHQIEIGPIKTAADDSSNPQDDRDPEEYIEASGQRHTEAGVTRKQRGTHFGQRRHPLLSPSHLKCFIGFKKGSG